MNASDQSSKIEKINKLQSRLLLAFSRYQIRAYFRAFMTRAHVSLSGRSGWKEAAGGAKSLRELPGARHTVPRVASAASHLPLVAVRTLQPKHTEQPELMAGLLDGRNNQVVFPLGFSNYKDCILFEAGSIYTR